MIISFEVKGTCQRNGQMEQSARTRKLSDKMCDLQSLYNSNVSLCSILILNYFITWNTM